MSSIFFFFPLSKSIFVLFLCGTKEQSSSSISGCRGLLEWEQLAAYVFDDLSLLN